MIGGILDRLIGNTFWSSVFGRVARSHCGAQRDAPASAIAGTLEMATMIERAEVKLSEVKLPQAIGALVQPDRLAGQHLADEDRRAAPSDLPGLAHFANLPMIGIDHFRQTRRIKPRRRPVDHGRRCIGNRLVRTLLIIDPPKVIEASLLGATSAIPGAEPAFKIDAPRIVGTYAVHEGRDVGGGHHTATPWNRKSMPMKKLSDRARRRPLRLRSNHLQTRLELAWPPTRMFGAQRHNPSLRLLAYRIWMMMRRVRTILQTVHPFGRITLQQLVTGLPADSEPPAQFGHRLLILLRQHNKLHPFRHGAGLFPRHRQALLPNCHLSPILRSKVLPIIPVRT